MAEANMTPQWLAAVDLGSNSFHMIVAELVDGELRITDRLREMVRLGGGLDEAGNLDEASRQRALDCLQRFGERLSALPHGAVRVVGTNTLRRARDPQFLLAAREALGHPIEVIPGVEEARLIYLGVAHGLADSDEMRLVVDIGGGSTEAILGRRFEALELESLFMGCVSFSRRFFEDGAITAKRMHKALLAARLEVQVIEREYRGIGWGEVVGASGTIKAVRDVVVANGWCEEGISYQALQKLVAKMVKAGHIDKLKLKGLKEERLPVFCGGVAVLQALFEGLGITQMHVSDLALREGLLYDMLGRLRHEDVRERTIAQLLSRYQVDLQQAERAEQTVLQLLTAVATAWSLDDDEARQLLSWAARLHECGLSISHTQYQKHGAYLLANGDLPGFTRLEQQQLALLVRAHRRKIPFDEIEALGEEVGPRILRLVLLLRLAVLLHRSRSDEPLPELLMAPEQGGLSLTFPDGWLDAHPLTAADLEQEQEWLQGARFHLLTA